METTVCLYDSLETPNGRDNDHLANNDEGAST